MIGIGMLGRAELFFVVLDIGYIQNPVFSKDVRCTAPQKLDEVVDQPRFQVCITRKLILVCYFQFKLSKIF